MSFFYFSKIADNEIVTFNYKQKRNAIRIIEINNYPKEIINEGIKISKKIDNATFFKLKN